MGLALTGIQAGVIVLAFCATFVASGVGMGGGGILVPLYTLMMGLSTKQAIPLSNATIFGGSIVNLIAYFKRRHPAVNKPLIDWDLILVMEPVTILGALIGSFINKLLPGWLTSFFLVVVLSVTTFRLLSKARRMYSEETSRQTKTLDSIDVKTEGIKSPIALQRLGSQEHMLEGPKTPPAKIPESRDFSLESNSSKDVTKGSENKGEMKAIEVNDLDEEIELNDLDEEDENDFMLGATSADGLRSNILAKIYADERRIPPWNKVGIVAAIFLLVLVLTIIRLFVPCGSAGFWTVVVVNFPLIVSEMLGDKYAFDLGILLDLHVGCVCVGVIGMCGM
ncbi:hypothetical protein AAMO2058_000288200 [Amorphochlora amoebiformis]